MSIRFTLPVQLPLAQEIPVDVENVIQPRYGRFLESFEPGMRFHHPRGLTIFPALALEFAGTFMQANPLYLNEPYARLHGFERLPVSPMLVLAAVLSQGVQNLSEQAVAHLGYYHVVFPCPTYAGDTIQAESEVVSLRWRGAGQPGVVRVRTWGRNQREQIVVQYERAILIPPERDDVDNSGEERAKSADNIEAVPIQLPLVSPRPMPPRTGLSSYFEDFRLGQIIAHGNGRTVTDEHIAWSYRLGNTHPLHNDRLYSLGRSGPLSGEPVVYGGLVLAWVEGLASRDCSENALWDLGYTEGTHTQPVIAGDTLYAVSRLLGKEEVPPDVGGGVLTWQLIGLKNLSAIDAIDRYGAALFQPESGKAREQRIPEKVLEIDRRLLVKKRTDWL